MGDLVEFSKMKFDYGEVSPLLKVRVGLKFPIYNPKTCWRIKKSRNGHVVWESPDGKDHLIHGVR